MELSCMCCLMECGMSCRRGSVGFFLFMSFVACLAERQVSRSQTSMICCRFYAISTVDSSMV